ncbi:hypothetical protein BC829DRAFT_412097 [Chytridium lagenaria]|nr:hypothetical protein BC829DRAFT_412097 [Chytridium lagenaria]
MLDKTGQGDTPIKRLKENQLSHTPIIFNTFPPVYSPIIRPLPHLHPSTPHNLIFSIHRSNTLSIFPSIIMNASQASLTKFFSPSISTDQAKNKEAGLKTGARFQPYPTKAPLKPSPSSTPPSYPTSFAKSASTSSTLSRNGSHTSSASVNGGHNGTVKTLMSGVTSTGFTRSISSSGGMSTGYNRAASMNTASSTAITTAPPRHFNPPLSAVSFESLQSL